MFRMGKSYLLLTNKRIITKQKERKYTAKNIKATKGCTKKRRIKLREKVNNNNIQNS